MDNVIYPIDNKYFIFVHKFEYPSILDTLDGSPLEGGREYTPPPYSA